MKLNLCWWNLGVSPPVLGKKKESSEAIDLAKKYILKFAKDKNIDFFAFCEVSTDDQEHFIEIAQELEMDYIDLYEKDGRMVLDFAVMYENSKLEHIPSLNKNLNIINPDGEKIRVGLRVVFKDLKTGEIITLFLSHWASRLMGNEQQRERAASSIRGRVDSILEEYGTDSQIICMGDYNDQPYSKSIHENLFATRDYHIIKNKRALLFNPFWSFLSDGRTNNIGTYHYKKGKNSNRWYVFDQMLFSSSFLFGGDDKLKLNYDSLGVHKILNEDNTIADSDFLDNFDHSPIFCEVSHEH